MGPDPKILDDIARIAGGAVNVASGMQQQFREEIRTRMEDMAAQMDLVPREDLEQAIAIIARLEERIDVMEKRLDELEPKKTTKKTVKKPSSKSKKTK